MCENVKTLAKATIFKS